MKGIVVLVLLLAQMVGNAFAGTPDNVGGAPVNVLQTPLRVATIVVPPEDAATLFEQEMHRAEEKNASLLILGLVVVLLLIFFLLGWLTKRSSRSKQLAQPKALPRVPVQMHWYDGTQLPIADWERISQDAPAEMNAEAVHVYRTSAAREWLEALNQQLGEHYRINESADFLLLSNLQDRPAVVVLETCQRMLSRISRSLGELAVEQGMGKYVVMVFADTEDYYAYVSHYYPEDGEYAMSSGMFIKAGYGHFVMPLEILDAMEPVIAHELTHCLLQHLPIPAWLNEGLAVNTEHTLFPQLAAPSAQMYFPHEIAAQHAAYWNEESIQTFWSGKSFLAMDDGNRLSYDLAKKITSLAAGDERAFRAFVAAAQMSDGGLSAEQNLGFPLHNLLEAVLGEGEWTPRPDAWMQGTERGQF
ncbi:hypothetical protein ABB26_03200 [Stenotrophomonas humi]|uniref:Peptidase MA-like domain-containing protein n=1 Tax=Stenotrophomonas humi TaxID=405444 RepID=A0A0R0CGM9_9GAMM|nr:hypothetical protein ABB26_03200 [Stenotrophomonas humi]